MRLNVSSAEWWPFCPGRNELNQYCQYGERAPTILRFKLILYQILDGQAILLDAHLFDTILLNYHSI